MAWVLVFSCALWISRHSEIQHVVRVREKRMPKSGIQAGVAASSVNAADSIGAHILSACQVTNCPYLTLQLFMTPFLECEQWRMRESLRHNTIGK